MHPKQTILKLRTQLHAGGRCQPHDTNCVALYDNGSDVERRVDVRHLQSRIPLGGSCLPKYAGHL